MLNLREKSMRACMLVGLVGLCSCVDNAYDLSDINTDEITIGKTVVAPLGSGLISAKKLLDVDNVKEITTNADGNYVARYTGEMTVGMASNPELTDFAFSFPTLDVQLPFASGTLSDNIEVPAGNTNYDIILTTSPEVVQLDSVVFNNIQTQSILSLSVQKSGFNVTGGTAKLHLEINFPAGYELTPLQLPSEAQFNDGQLTYEGNLRNFNGITMKFHLDKIVTDPDDKIVCEASFNFKAGCTVDIRGNQSLSISGGIQDPAYEVIYGEFKNDFKSEDINIDMKGLDDVFKGQDNVLSFADPRILFQTESNIGIPLDASISIISENQTTGKRVSTSVSGIALAAPAEYGTTASNNIWIGGSAQSVPQEYTFIQNEKLNDILKISPDNIRFQAGVVSGTQKRMFFPNDGSAKLSYTVEIPFAPAADFKASLEEKLEDIFDQDLVDYLFTGGNAEIYGDITNSLPVDLTMNMVITDRYNNPVGIDLTPQQIAAGAGSAQVSKVSFKIPESEMPKMKHARNIALELTVTGSEKTQGMHLRPEQEVKLDLKIRKDGGITINND